MWPKPQEGLGNPLGAKQGQQCVVKSRNFVSSLPSQCLKVNACNCNMRAVASTCCRFIKIKLDNATEVLDSALDTVKRPCQPCGRSR